MHKKEISSLQKLRHNLINKCNLVTKNHDIGYTRNPKMLKENNAVYKILYTDRHNYLKNMFRIKRQNNINQDQLSVCGRTMEKHFLYFFIVSIFMTSRYFLCNDCFGLNVFPPNSYLEILTSKDDGTRWWGLCEVLKPSRCRPHKQNQCPYKKGYRETASPFPPREDTKRSL